MRRRVGSREGERERRMVKQIDGSPSTGKDIQTEYEPYVRQVEQR